MVKVCLALTITNIRKLIFGRERYLKLKKHWGLTKTALIRLTGCSQSINKLNQQLHNSDQSPVQPRFQGLFQAREKALGTSLSPVSLVHNGTLEKGWTWKGHGHFFPSALLEYFLKDITRCLEEHNFCKGFFLR